MRLIVTILEETFDAALRAIAEVPEAVELRAENLGTIDLRALRAATSQPIILTYRGQNVSEETIRAAIEAGIDLVDVEWREGLDLARYRERIVLSHHDYKGMPDVESILEAMLAHGCAHTKLAVTPRTMQDNLRLLALLRPGVTIIGMGERGLYSRILAPFLGSELVFVGSAAPGQISLERAREIYGVIPSVARDLGGGSARSGKVPRYARHDRIFAIAGDPAGHSLSPTIHNPLFREKGVDAAYTIASFVTFAEIAEAFEQGALRGMSITKPFKEEAFAYAERTGATIAENARACKAVNTLVRTKTGVLADNTDVDGFAALIGTPKRAAIVGAGGTARAAMVALQRVGAEVRVFNRSARLNAEPLEAIRDYEGDLIIDTLPVEIELPKHIPIIEARYRDNTGTGYALLRAQAIRQNELFVQALT